MAHSDKFSALLTPLVEEVRVFLKEQIDLCLPDDVWICDGSEEEYQKLIDGLVKHGTLIPCNQEKLPGCYLARTDPGDTARSEHDTFICCKEKKNAGPTNNWVDPDVKRKELRDLFNGCMRGRTMYVVPFSMGPIGSKMAKIGIEITDSAYVVINMKIMTHMGTQALQSLSEHHEEEYVKAVHSVGVPVLDPSSPEAKLTWPCNLKHRNICHFPETDEIVSFGSGYGGNSLLGKKCFALRIASTMGQREGWLAEHMLIIGVTNPQGVKKYLVAAFPSQCGKTNMALMQAALPGYKVETIGDDIAWIKPGKDGKLYAINPEAGFFGVCPGTNYHTNPTAMRTMVKNSIFTNVGLTEDGDVYWEGLDLPKTKITDWHGKPDWKPTYKANGKIDEKTNPCAQPNSRFTAPTSQCPTLDELWNSPEGVPVDGIIFGGRRSDTVPLVIEANSWAHGVFLGSVMRSQATSASDTTGLVSDPMAIKAFCGYSIKDYFAHWLTFEEKCGKSLPKIFHVNWFRLSPEGKFLWPGFGDNIRVIDWMMQRMDGRGKAKETPVGFVPTEDALNTEGIDVDATSMKQLLAVDKEQWEKEILHIEEYYSQTLVNEEYPTPIPPPLVAELKQLASKFGVPLTKF